MPDNAALSVFKSFIDVLFPPVCPSCEHDLQEDGLCGKCLALLSAHKTKDPVCSVCGIPFASDAGDGRPCGACLKEDQPFIEARSAFTYDKAVLKTIHKFKYGGHVILAPALGRLMARAAKFSATPEIIVPVPLHKKRLRERGFNQSLLLAREASSALSVPIDYKNLLRVRPTEQQVNLGADERKRNVAGAFSVKDAAHFKGRRVLLVDDVYTTGATIRECSKVLKKSGAKVFVITLARAVKV